MKQEFTDLIYLFSCGAMGMKPAIDHDINISGIYKLAVSQGIWHTVFLAVKGLYDDGKLKMDPEVVKALNNQMLSVVFSNAKRYTIIHDLLHKLEESNVKCCVLKGEVLSYLYDTPSCRISGDTDILIDIQNKNKSIKILAECGFEVEPMHGTSHHVVAVHPVAGTVELHLHLHDELFEDVWFDNKVLNQEEYRFIKADDGKDIPTLGITDGLIFVTLHYTKHFLSRGVGIRQLMDVLLYMKYYKNQINWERFNDLMEHLKFQKFIDNSIGIGVEYLNFTQENLPKFTCNDHIMTKILYDIENGGVFGTNEDERMGFYMEYTKERFNRFKNEDYNAYIKKWWRPNEMNIIFPHIKILAQKFPYVEKTPILYPVAWIHRIICLLIGLVKKEKSMNRYTGPEKNLNEKDIIKQRMDLIRELDMI